MTRPNSRFLIISLHDVTPSHKDHILEAVKFLDSIGVNGISLLVVPEYHGHSLSVDREFLKWLDVRKSRGDEIVLHGLHHKENKPPRGFIRTIRRMLFTRGEGECLGLEPDEFEDILSSGEKVLSPVEPAPVGFVAPAWLIEPALYAVLKSRNYLYTTRQTAIVDLVNNRTITSPAVVLRGSSRFMNRFSRFLNTMLLTFLTRLDIVRVAIHPADIRYDAHNWYSKVLKQLMRNRTTITYGKLMTLFGTEANFDT